MGRPAVTPLLQFCRSLVNPNSGVMEGGGTGSSCQSEESSVLDLPCVVTAEEFVLFSNAERNNEILSSVDEFVSPATTSNDTEPNSKDFIARPAEAEATLWPRSCEKTEPTNCVNSEHPLSWVNEKKDGEAVIRKSLDTFYETCCQRKPFGGSTAYEAASQCVSVKIADLADKEGTEYTQKSLRVAQMVLNQEGNKMFPQHSSGTCFSAPTKAGIDLEEAKEVPGLSDDILQFILKELN